MGYDRIRSRPPQPSKDQKQVRRRLHGRGPETPLVRDKLLQMLVQPPAESFEGGAVPPLESLRPDLLRRAVHGNRRAGNRAAL
jgi:hypothetical protein